MEVKIKLGPEGKMPTKAHATDAGYDLYAASMEFDRKNRSLVYDTQVHVEIPKGHVGLVFPRSSINDYNLSLTNSVGVIDSGFSGSIKAKFKHAMNKVTGDKFYQVGDRIAQLVIIPYPEIEFCQVQELSETDRGDSGFGSTGE